MSDYLVRQIQAADTITVRLRTEVVGAIGAGRLEHLTSPAACVSGRSSGSPPRSGKAPSPSSSSTSTSANGSGLRRPIRPGSDRFGRPVGCGSMDELPGEELADRSGVTAEQLRRLVELGIITPTPRAASGPDPAGASLQQQAVPRLPRPHRSPHSVAFAPSLSWRSADAVLHSYDGDDFLGPWSARVQPAARCSLAVVAARLAWNRLASRSILARWVASRSRAWAACGCRPSMPNRFQ
jgi:hypothetical protein